MGSKHTPGPWTMKDYNGIIEVQCSDKVPVVKWGGFDECLRTAKEHIANARLIAAAPELLEVLKEITALNGEYVAASRIINFEVVHCIPTSEDVASAELVISNFHRKYGALQEKACTIIAKAVES